MVLGEMKTYKNTHDTTNGCEEGRKQGGIGDQEPASSERVTSFDTFFSSSLPPSFLSCMF